MSAAGRGSAPRTGAPGASEPPARAPAAARPERVARGARLPERALWVDGEIVRGAAAALTLFDRGVRDGGGLFETVLVRAGAPIRLDRHLERMVLSAARLGFPVPPSPARWRAALAAVIEANGLADAAARLTVTRGVPQGRPTRAAAWVDAEPLEARRWRGARTGAAALVCSATPFEPGPLGAHKTTSRLAYDLAREEARAAGADEALLLARDGEVLEGAASNVFVARGGEVLTPPLSRGILPGIARAVTLECCAALGIAAREARLTRADLAAADEVFVTNAIQGVAPAATFDGAPIRERALGARLAAAFDARGD